jgi:hypothetical protein
MTEGVFSHCFPLNREFQAIFIACSVSDNIHGVKYYKFLFCQRKTYFSSIFLSESCFWQEMAGNILNTDTGYIFSKGGGGIFLNGG